MNEQEKLEFIRMDNIARYLECFFYGSDRNEITDIMIHKYDINDENFGLDKDTIEKLRLLCLSSIILGDFNEVDRYRVYRVYIQ